MKPLREFDCLSLTPLAATAISKVRLRRSFPQAMCAASLDVEAQLEALYSMTGTYVLYLPAYVLPTHGLGSITPDALLLNAGYRVGWLARNVVTSQLVDQPAPELWLRSDLVAVLEVDGHKPELATIPLHQADWAFNTSSGAAFTAAFAYVSALNDSGLTPEHKAQKAAVAASFGSEAPFADWWHLGVLSALLGATDRIFAYEKEKTINDNEADMQGRLADLARQAKQELGLNLYTISPKNSGFFRQNQFLKPERSAYEAIALHYDNLGNSGAKTAQKYRDAASWVWGT